MNEEKPEVVTVCKCHKNEVESVDYFTDLKVKEGIIRPIQRCFYEIVRVFVE